MKLEHLYRIRFVYPEIWGITLNGGWEQTFAIAEGRCEGEISGRFRGANYPKRYGEDGPFRPIFEPSLKQMTGPQSCSSGMVTDGHILPEGGRSLGPSSISPMMNATSDSMMWSVFVLVRCERRVPGRRKVPVLARIDRMLPSWSSMSRS